MAWILMSITWVNTNDTQHEFIDRQAHKQTHTHVRTQEHIQLVQIISVQVLIRPPRHYNINIMTIIGLSIIIITRNSFFWTWYLSHCYILLITSLSVFLHYNIERSERNVIRGYNTAVFISAPISSQSVDISPRPSRGLMSTEGLV